MKILPEEQEECLKKVMMLIIFITTRINNNQMHTTVKKAKTKTKQKTECVTAGDIVWAKHGRIWYPAHVCTKHEIPELALLNLTKNIQGNLFVKWQGEDSFQMLNNWHKTKLMNTEHQDQLKQQKHITLAYMKSLTFSTNTFVCEYYTILP